MATRPRRRPMAWNINSNRAEYEKVPGQWVRAPTPTGTGGGPVSDGDYGDLVVSGSGSIWTIDGNVVSNSKFRQSVATSVVGRSSGTTGNVGDIQASSDNTFLGRLSGALAWVSIDHAILSSGSRVWTASGHTGTANRYAGFDGSGNAAYFTAAQVLDDVLSVKGDILVFSTVPVALAVGTTATSSDGPYFVTADSTATTGLKWINGYARQLVTAPDAYTTISMPDRKICKRVMITIQGPGNAGVAGDSAAGNGNGGRPGSAGARTILEFARSQLPDTLYAYPSGKTDAVQSHSIVQYSNTGYTGGSTLPDAGTIVGYAVGAANGGAAVVATLVSAQGHRVASRFTATPSAAAAAGGGAGVTPTAIVYPGSGTAGPCSAGCGGAGKTAVAAAAGGGYSATGSPLGALAGGTNPGGAGADGTYGGGSASGYTTASSDLGELAWAYGGRGGGSVTAGTGGKGGDGAPGCGGGGGGAGITGGAKGLGGDGYILFEFFAF